MLSRPDKAMRILKLAGVLTFATLSGSGPALGQGANWDEWARIRLGESPTAPAMELTQPVVYTRVPRTRGRYEGSCPV